MQIRRVPITHPDAQALIDAVQLVYVERYGTPDASPIDPAEFAEPAGAFYVGYDDEEPVATGAWRTKVVERLGTSRAAEIKRMYVVPTRQRRGYARQMLAHLEDEAAAAGHTAVVLETGTAQPEAIAMYTAAGYERIEPYGYYAEAPEVVCFGRRLPRGVTAPASGPGPAAR